MNETTKQSGPPLAVALAVVKGYDFSESACVWTLCVGRWRWPVWRGPNCDPNETTGHMFGWIHGIGWAWS